MRRQIKEALDKGLPVMAECGGFMYLHQYFQDMEGNDREGIGAIEGRAYKTPRLSRFGYLTLEKKEGDVFGKKIGSCPAHEFHYFDSTNCGGDFTDKSRKAAGDGTVSTVQIPCSPDFLIFITGEIPDLPQLMWIDAETMQKREEEAVMNLQEAVESIRPLDEKAMEQSREHWDSIAHPLHSLGKLEDMVVQIAGITEDPRVHVDKRVLVPMCADNGVVEEGVTQTGQEITALVAESFLQTKAASSIMCRTVKCDIFPCRCGSSYRCEHSQPENCLWNKKYGERAGHDQRTGHSVY